MKRTALLLVALALPVTAGWAQGVRPTSMPAFSSDSAMRAYIQRILDRRERFSRRSLGMGNAAPAMAGVAADMTATQGAGEGITNNQTAGVDEGGIVKMHGNYLVVLRRGRLFTVAVGSNNLAPVDAEDAFGPGIDPGGTWYDEMLISGDKIVVIGFSYSRGGTEAGVFRISDAGQLSYITTFQLRSNDYYSSRNYAARLIGTRLVFYSPLYLQAGGNVNDVLPAMQRWSAGGNSRFRPIVRGDKVYRPVGQEPTDDLALHTVTSCDLADPDIRCEASVVLGPPGRVFYVSGSSVYVWMSSWRSNASGTGRMMSLLVRMPLDGTKPSAIRVAGSPVDQFSFYESDDGHINVLTRATGNGEAMWSSEGSTGRAALLRLPIERMGDGGSAAPGTMYRQLPTPPANTFQNRFVGDFLLYGSGNGWGPTTQTDTTLYAVPWRGGNLTILALSHGIDRIEVMGSDAVIVGARGANLEFTGVRLRAARPMIAQRFIMPQASQGELRSHGFFYRVDGADTGVLGLPVREGNRPGYRHLVEGSASIVYLRNNGRRFSELGVLEASDVRSANDGCRASCVDWYGNARPIFARGRVFALLGYEIVEGAVTDGALAETRRVNFSTVLTAMNR